MLRLDIRWGMAMARARPAADPDQPPRTTELSTQVFAPAQEQCEPEGITDVLNENGKISGWVDEAGNAAGLSWCPADAPYTILYDAMWAAMYRCQLLDAVAKEEPGSPKAATEEQILEGTATYGQILKHIKLDHIKKICDEIDEKNWLGGDGRFGDELADDLKTNGPQCGCPNYMTLEP